jgi:SAM-dependent methyltransferase
MRSLIFRVCFTLVRGCHLGMEFFRLGARLFTSTAWGVARRSDLVDLVRARWDRELALASESLVMRGLFSWEEALYQRHLAGRKSIGLIGCGAGRDLIALARRGHAVVGVDLSSEMIQKARSYLEAAGIDAPLYAADVHGFNFPDRRYDAFVFSNFTYVLIPGSTHRIEMLQSLRRQLSPDGCVAVTYFGNQADREGWTIRLARLVSRITRNPDQPEMGDELSRFHDFQHHFTHAEVALEAKSAGFEVGEVSAIPDFNDGYASILRPSSSMDDARLSRSNVARGG